MANRTHYDVKTGVGNELIINPVSFIGNSSSSPTVFSDEILSVTRAGAGDFDVVFRHKYPTEVAVVPSVYGSTAGLHARVSAWDAAAGTLTVNTESAGSAAGTAAAWTTGIAVTSDEAVMASAGRVVAVHATTQTGVPPAWTTGVTVTTDEATMADAGHVVAVHATTQTGLFPAWVTGLTVTAHELTLSDPGYVISVEGTTGDGTGAKQIQNSGSPAAGFVTVAYDAAGIATLTFNATDNLTEAAVVFTRTGAGMSSKRVISTGTPAPGEVLVAYTSGVATLTFAADDAVSEAAVTLLRPGSLMSNKAIISTGTPSVGEVAVVYTAGVATLTFAADDAATEASVLLDPVQSSTSAAAADPSTGDTIYLFLYTRNSSYARP